MEHQNMRWLAAMLGCAMWMAAVAPASRAADPVRPGDAARAPAEQRRRVVQFLTIDFDGGNQWMYASPVGGGQPLRFLMSDELRRNFRGTRRQALIWVTTQVGITGVEMVSEASAYDGPRELASPRAYVFDGLDERKTGVTTQTVVMLSKFGQKLTAMLPGKPAGAGSAGAADPLVDRLRALSPGDVIEIEAQRQGDSLVLLDVDRYREPVFAELVRTGTVNIAGKAVAGVMLSVDGVQKAYALPPPNPINPAPAALAAQVSRLRPGAYIWYTARDEATPPKLRDLRPDVSIRPRSADDLEILATFCRVRLSSRGSTWTYCEVIPENHRPEDRTLEAGCRRLTADALEAEKAGLRPLQIQQIKALLELMAPPAGDGGGFGRRWRNNKNANNSLVSQAERDQFAQVYRTFLQARDPEERWLIEQRMIAAATELSSRFRKEADLNLVTLKGVLSAEQLSTATRLGEQELERRDN